ncbi:MAG TPA: nitrogen regulation protein NR(II) [Ideonella sp.]|uniref:nitrogen regulation protein NR(II) n=1 Tax=Ideonella sp. TaxID=1929293 RepID=UPI002BBAC4EF|nr:nitrogen regulation protein NR(II) [Ideonella sp.]HSI47927.1 nitrogen regulation protein NR(II) [Ideonella sp.]
MKLLRPRESAEAKAWETFDLLATMVAVVQPDGTCLFVNSVLESVIGLSRKALLKRSMLEWFREPAALSEAIDAVARNEFATRRFEGALRRAVVGHHEPLPVHIIVSQTEHSHTRILVEMLEIEQQTKQDREERALGQAQVTKELIRNLAHEIKNPLGGIRGAAQLLAMDLPSPELIEYTQVIIHEADRLQLLVDRLLAPHRKPHVVTDVNIHEVCERVRSLVLAEHSRGLEVVRDYDASIPEFRGDREQLIQALLNIVHNASQALTERIDAGDAQIVLRTRIARQVTIGKQRNRLALELHIQDNGPGVPDHLRERIFFPLVSGREGGSGLGLTLAQTFVQQHQGMIECDSEPGRTVFKIVIPLP